MYFRRLRIVVAQRGFAASDQRSAISFQPSALNESREHAFDFRRFQREFVVIRGGDEQKVSGQEQMILEFTGRAAGNRAEPSQLRVSISATALRQVGTNRRAGTPDLTG